VADFSSDRQTFNKFKQIQHSCRFTPAEFLKGPKHEIFESGFLHKSEAYGQVTSGLAKKIEISKVGVIIFKVFAARFLLSIRSACA
jgi:hypothetical protein